MKIKVRQGLGHGDYDLLDAETGEVVGNVRKKVERYNLRRPVTVTTWRLSVKGREGGRTDHRTRADAVAEAEKVLSA